MLKSAARHGKINVKVRSLLVFRYFVSLRCYVVHHEESMV